MFEKYFCCKTYIIHNCLITNYFTIKIFLKKYNQTIKSGADISYFRNNHYKLKLIQSTTNKEFQQIFS